MAVMQARSTKRDRKPNFSTDEVTVILTEVAAEKDVLFSKFQNCLTNKSKENAWIKITEKVNACGVAKRSLVDVKTKFKALKQNNWAEPKKSRGATGGGAPDKAAPYEELFGQILGKDTALTEGLPVQGTETGWASFNSDGGTLEFEVLSLPTTMPLNAENLENAGNVEIADYCRLDGVPVLNSSTAGVEHVGTSVIILNGQADVAGPSSSASCSSKSDSASQAADVARPSSSASCPSTPGGVVEAAVCRDESQVTGRLPKGSPCNSRPSIRNLVRRRKRQRHDSAVDETKKWMEWMDGAIALQEEQRSNLKIMNKKATLEIIKMKKEMGMAVTEKELAEVE